MKKVLLSLVAGVALAGYVNAQTTYADFEGVVPYQYTFGGSSFSVVDNPSKTGVNTSNKVAMTQKAATGAETWGGAGFPLGGAINFAAGANTFTMDVYSAVAGIATFKIEKSATQGDVEIKQNYTTPGEWQTLTYTFDGRDANYKQITIFMGFDSKATDVWYYDNIKGPGITVGAPVDVTFSLSDLGGTVTSAEVELSNAPGTKLPLTGTAGVGATWTKVLTAVTGSTIANPITYTMYVNGNTTPEFTNQPFATAGSAASVIAKNFGTAPVGVNLINNGTFDGIEGALAGWTGKNWGAWTGNAGSITVQNGVAYCSPVASNDAWQLQLEQHNFVLENGKTYAASFDAWSVDFRQLTLSIEDPSNGYALLGTTTDADGLLDAGDGLRHSKWDMAITDTKATYTRTLTVDKAKANTDFKFVFLLAQASDLVYIDNVSLKEITNVSVGENKANAVKFYPNPAQNELYFSGRARLSNVSVYSLVGAQVKEFKNVSESLNISDLKPGVYMVKVTDENGKTSTTKFLKK